MNSPRLRALPTLPAFHSHNRHDCTAFAPFPEGLEPNLFVNAKTLEIGNTPGKLFRLGKTRITTLFLLEWMWALPITDFNVVGGKHLDELCNCR